LRKAQKSANANPRMLTKNKKRKHAQKRAPMGPNLRPCDLSLRRAYGPPPPTPQHRAGPAALRPIASGLRPAAPNFNALYCWVAAQSFLLKWAV